MTTAVDPDYSPASLRLEDLDCSFADHHVVKGINLDIKGGEFFSLLGPSGCGKTTTLRMIAGLEQATGGRILVDGKEIQGVPPHRRPVHTVFQNYALFPHLNVFENVAFGLRERKEGKQAIQEKVGRLLDLVELTGKENHRPRQLSGGMQQRVALARSLVLGPRVLLLDEPLGALDLRMRRQMQVLLKSVQHELGITFVYVTHDQEEAFAMSDRVGLMQDGDLVQVATPAEVYHQPATRFAAGFVGASNSLDGVVTAAGQGTYDVSIPGVGQGRIDGVGEVPGDKRVTMILRPEVVGLQSDEPSDFRADGIVRDIAFLGARTSVRVELAGGQVVTADLASRTLPASVSPDAPCRVSWRSADLWAVTR
ncbi:ABC transporter ATP-binding protein [Nocardioides sp. W7]|uniref:ABC transporter ATP-binding protein n=1 Tax=Nocardioides sp. W7 TaxID=2931390 RepID=UPI001FD03296|nr:ABC transporter ATP-binding protein [Nocardioides sp. W7]